MSFIKKYILKIFTITTIIAAMYSCENLSTPIEDNPVLKLKTEKKWKVDPLNDDRLYVVKVKEYDIIGNLVFTQEYNSVGNLNTQSTYTYTDEESSKEEKIIYNQDGSKQNNVVIEYTFNTNNQIKKKIEYDSSGVVVSVFEYNYDNKGNLIRKDEIKPNGSQQTVDFNYTYNPQGDLIERKVTSNGNIVNRDSLTYNYNSSSFDVINLNQTTGLIDGKTTFIYNKKGLINTEIELSSAGKVLNKYIYEYLYYSK